MGKKTRTLTLSAIYSALTIVMLYIASIWPTGQVGLVAITSFFTAAAVIEAGFVSGVSVYAVSSLLGFLLIPNRVAAILFVVFFGYYPVVKSLIERIRWSILQWVFKLLVFNAAMALLWVLLSALIIDYVDNDISVILLLLAGNVIFVLFDYGFTKVIWLYLDRISKYRRSI